MSALIPVVPNWSGGIAETYEFKTDLLTARDGTEQRRSLRQDPRLTISYTAIADKTRLRALEQAQVAIGTGQLLPNYLKKVKLTTALPNGGSTAKVSSVPVWLVEGAMLALRYRRTVKLIEVEVISGMTISFAAASDQAWPAGSYLHPLYSGDLTPSQIDFYSETGGTTKVEFSVDPGSATFDAGEPGALLGSIEILTVRPNRATPPTAAYAREVDAVDYGFGRAVYYNPVPYAARVFQATYYDQGGDDGEALRRFFLRQAGQRRYFYVPSWTDDFEIVSAEEGSSEIIIAGTEAYVAFEAQSVHRAMWIRLNDDSQLAVAFTGMTVSEGNTSLTLAEPLTVTIDPTNVRSASWLYLCRFATDQMTFNWIMDTTFSAMLSVKTLPGSAAEDSLDDGLDGASRYMIRTYGWDFTLNVLYNPLENSMATWVEISAGVPHHS